MRDDTFYRLSPFIREYIYKNNWTSLRQIQVDACEIIFDTDDHLLLASGTASGKTEAAFLPVLTKLLEDPPLTVGVLYIAPLKALINDQFYRLEDMIKEAGIKLRHWHGDVPANKKTRFLDEPSGILQITPESLESMLINRNRELMKIFGDLRFIIIDEIHAFMGSDRGLQVQCQIQRLSEYVRSEPRRIGLSATLGDYTIATKWLAAGSDRNVALPDTSGWQQKIRLSVEHFKKPELEGLTNPMTDPSMVYMYEKTLGRKCIIFGNGRETPETAIEGLKYIANLKGTPDVYHVHHGSISAPLRETAEVDMKESEGPVVIGATVTLELGVDIGRLDRIIQISPPISVASLVQRLGRSGRRENPAEMWFIDWDTSGDSTRSAPYRIPWFLVQICAMLQLYLEERWIEPAKILKYPLSMAYHQIMSIVASAGELSLDALQEKFYRLNGFSNIRRDDFVEFIIHLTKMDHLQLLEKRGLIIGLEGAKITENYKFYAVFPEEEEWAIMADSQKIGCIEYPIPPGEYVTVAGCNWHVKAVDNTRRIIFVEHTKRLVRYFWKGDRAIIHNRILQRMKQVLLEPTVYPYLQEGARQKLAQARDIAAQIKIENHNIIPMDEYNFCILPWMGHIDYYTFLKALYYYGKDSIGIENTGGFRPYFITLRMKEKNIDIEEVLNKIKQIFKEKPNPNDFIKDYEVRQLKKQFEYKVPKYDRFIPDKMLKQQLIEDYIDMHSIWKTIEKWK